jgi:galactitol-specific phosphotransferase system IIB component
MAKGIENIITNISRQLGTIEVAIDQIYYGDPLKTSGGIRLPGTSKNINGVLPITQEIAKYDLCNILSTTLQNIKIDGVSSALSKKLDKVKEQAQKLSNQIDVSKLSAAVIKNPEKRAAILTSINELSNSIDSDVAAISPQIVVTKNYIDDIVGSITNVSIGKDNLNQIPNADVQKILSGIQGVRSTLDNLANLGTAQDLINLASNIPGLNLASQIQNLNKAINPAQIIPALQQVATLLKSINQIGLKILSYLNILQIVGKILDILVKVLTVVTAILKAIAIPGLAIVTTITTKLATGVEDLKKQILAASKIVKEIQSLVDLIYNFTVGVLGKISELQAAIESIIYNLQICRVTENSPVLQDLKDSKAVLSNTATNLQAFVKDYASVDRNQQPYGSYTLKIVEEELVDSEIKYKRRKAIALDQRGVLVAETSLTFATDNNILFEEIKLLLQNQGLPIEAGVGNAIQDTYKMLGVTDATQLTSNAAEVQKEVSTFIDALPGGTSFRRKIQQQIVSSTTQTAQEIKSKAISNLAGSSTRYPIQAQTQTISTGTKVNSDLLTPSQRAKWQSISTSTTAPSILKQKANLILKNDLAAQGEVGISTGRTS